MKVNYILLSLLVYLSCVLAVTPVRTVSCKICAFWFILLGDEYCSKSHKVNIRLTHLSRTFIGLKIKRKKS